MADTAAETDEARRKREASEKEDAARRGHEHKEPERKEPDHHK